MARERQYEVPESDERDYPADFADIQENGHRPLHDHFAEWVAQKTGAKFSTQKELAAFKLGVGFGIRYRMDHQRAKDGAHAFHLEQDSTRAAAADERAQATAARKAARAAKAEPEEAPAPRRGRPRKTAPVEEAPAAKPARRGRPAKATAAAETPAPKATASAKPARRPAAGTRPGRPARRSAGTSEPAF